jgi:hypothetical protein
MEREARLIVGEKLLIGLFFSYAIVFFFHIHAPIIPGVLKPWKVVFNNGCPL